MNDTTNSAETKENAPGVLLSAARKKAGLSVEEIASRMNLTVEVIEGIEADNYQASLSPAFYRGYLRTYSQIVGLDSDSLIDSFNHRINQGSLSNKIVPTFDTDLYAEKDRDLPILKWFLITALFIVVGVIGYYIWTQKFSETNSNQIEIPIETDSEESGIQLDLSSVDEIEADKADRDHAALITDDGNNAVESTNTEVTQEDETPEEVIEEEAGSPVSESDVRLVMSFSGDCWVKVTDNSGEVLALGIKRTGKIMELKGEAPFNIIMGNSAVVDINYNDLPVDLSSFPAGNRVEMELSGNSEYLR